MKRALFKMGRKFTVESASADSKFSVVVDVENWMSPARERDWSFPLEDRQTLSNFPGRNTGTYIQVTSLLRDVSAQFSNDRFLNVLANEVGTVHLFSIQRGLKISLNKVPIKVTPLTLKHSKLIRPAFKEFEYNGAPNKVKVEMFAGVSDYNADAAGWYIFCNKRLVIKADQTLATGWGERGGMNPRIPKYHPQFAYYRGYLFLDCDDAARLPWNTTKTGVDLDSELYRQVREQMMEPMRQVIDWLNKLKEEKDRKATDEDVLELESAIGDAEEHDLMLLLQQLRKQAKGKPIKKLPFKAPIAREVRDQTKLITISYRKPEEEVQRVKQVLHVTKNREVGEKTFEFYLKRMC
jgi:hypothetical protein